MLKPKRLHFVNIINAFLPTSRSLSLKRRMYRWAGVQISDTADIFSGAKISGDGEVIIGEHVWIGTDATIMCNKGSKVIIEDYALVGHQSIIVTGFHPITPEGPRINGYKGTCSTVRICKGAALGTRATLLPGKTMGEMSFAVACSVVTHDVEAYTQVGGNPARFMKAFKNQQ